MTASRLAGLLLLIGLGAACGVSKQLIEPSSWKEEFALTETTRLSTLAGQNV